MLNPVPLRGETLMSLSWTALPGQRLRADPNDTPFSGVCRAHGPLALPRSTGAMKDSVRIT